MSGISRLDISSSEYGAEPNSSPDILHGNIKTLSLPSLEADFIWESVKTDNLFESTVISVDNSGLPSQRHDLSVIRCTAVGHVLVVITSRPDRSPCINCVSDFKHRPHGDGSHRLGPADSPPWPVIPRALCSHLHPHPTHRSHIPQCFLTDCWVDTANRMSSNLWSIWEDFGHEDQSRGTIRSPLMVTPYPVWPVAAVP